MAKTTALTVDTRDWDRKVRAVQALMLWPKVILNAGRFYADQVIDDMFDKKTRKRRGADWPPFSPSTLSGRRPSGATYDSSSRLLQDTGALRLQATRTTFVDSPTELAFGTRLAHGKFQHTGTINGIPARPYLFWEVPKDEQAMIRIMARAVAIRYSAGAIAPGEEYVLAQAALAEIF